MNEQLNATHLFRYPEAKTHNSESWWSALFSMLVLYLSSHPDVPRLPLKKCKGGRNWYFEQVGSLDCGGLRHQNVLVDQKLTGDLLGMPSWPEALEGLRPDVLFFCPSRKKAVLIENKTFGTELGDQFGRYLKACEELKKHAWDARTFLLISAGYENEADWKTIEDQGITLILWEDVLRTIDWIESFRSLFDLDLRRFYDVEQQHCEVR